MKKLATFRHVLTKSLSDRSYYQTLLSTPFKFSLKYFIALIAITVTLQITTVSLQLGFLLPQLAPTLNSLHNRLSELYPEDLTITIDNGTLSINQDTPYTIDIPELSRELQVDHAITIDPEAEVGDFLEYDSLVLITDQEIVSGDYGQNDASRYQVFPFSDAQGTTVFTAEDYENLMTQTGTFFDALVQYAPWILVGFAVLAPLLFSLFSILWELLYLVFLTALLYLVMQVFKLRISYGKLYQLGLHGVTIPIVLNIVTLILGVHIPLLFTSAFLLWMVLVLSKLEKSKL